MSAQGTYGVAPVEPPPYSFGRPRRSASEQLAGGGGAPPPPQVFQPLPAPTGASPFRLDLATVIGTDAAKAIETLGTLVFHAVGDSGGVNSPQPQQIVADWMDNDLSTLNPAPSFFYHLGDVVYFDGERNQYYPQFYEPYLHYQAPVLGIPGNHDGDLAVPPVGTSLEGFMVNFCSPTATVTPDAQDVSRPAMTQPNCYWTLTAPLVTIVGLYTNCPEHGVVQQDQADWFKGELEAADEEKALIVALHHPPYSADAHHGSSPAMRQLLSDAFTASGRTPDLVLTGHVHNYQRFSVPTNGKTLTYIVAGAGGYPNLHTMAHVDGAPPPTPWLDPGTGATLESYNKEMRHGFLRLTVTKTKIEGVYTTVPRPQESWSSGPVQQIDTFSIAL
jgi:calcineurin-like phosphoesterase family protein